jgi:hypothetical protein
MIPINVKVLGAEMVQQLIINGYPLGGAIDVPNAEIIDEFETNYLTIRSSLDKASFDEKLNGSGRLVFEVLNPAGQVYRDALLRNVPWLPSFNVQALDVEHNNRDTD